MFALLHVALVVVATSANATHRQMLDIFTVSVWQMSTLLYNDVSAFVVCYCQGKGRGGGGETLSCSHCRLV